MRDSPLMHSGMARVTGSHNFTYYPHIYPQVE